MIILMNQVKHFLINVIEYSYSLSVGNIFSGSNTAPFPAMGVGGVSLLV